MGTVRGCKCVILEGNGVVSEKTFRICMGLAAGAASLTLLSLASGAFSPQRNVEPSPRRPASAWRYVGETDAMRGTRIQVARVKAREPVLVNGRAYEAWLEVTNGESQAIRIVSDAISYCTDRTYITLRIDDGPLESASCRQYADMPSRTFWLIPFWTHGTPMSYENRPGPFPARIANAQTVIVELPTWGGGAQAEFDVRGLESWMVRDALEEATL